MKTLDDIQKLVLAPNWNNSNPLLNVQIGSGFNSFQNCVMAQALVSIKKSNQTLTSSSSFVSIESITQLRKSLGVSFDASVSSLFFSAEDNFDYTETSDFNTYDFFALATVSVRLKSDILDGTDPNAGDLMDHAQQDARNMTQLDFWKKYGDSYVNRIDYGGTLFGLLHVQCQTADQKTNLRNQLTLSGGGVSLDATITSMYESMSKVGKVETLFMTTGVPPALVDQDTFKTAIMSFSDQVQKTGGSPLSFGLATYDTSNWPDDAKPKADFTKPRNWVAQELANAEQCQGLLDDISYAISNQNAFDFSSISLDQLKNETNTLNSVMESIYSEVENIIEDPVSATQPNIFDIDNIIVPNMRPTAPPNIVTTVGAYQVGVVAGNSNCWVGIQGTPLDSFTVYNPPGDPLDLHFSYTGKFVSIVALGLVINPPPYQESSGDGGKAGAVGPGYLFGVSITLGGSDAYLFDVCYQLRLKDGTLTGIGVNGAWVEVPTPTDILANVPDALKVYLQPKLH